MKLEDTTLYNIAQPVVFGKPKQLKKFADKMLRVMSTHSGIGLAATQVGFDKRVFVMKINGNIYRIFNPLIVSRSEKITSFEEGCLSFPGTRIDISRSESITAEWYNEYGKLNVSEMDGLLARCFQHEYDHLNGITIMERQNAEKQS